MPSNARWAAASSTWAPPRWTSRTMPTRCACANPWTWSSADVRRLLLALAGRIEATAGAADHGLYPSAARRADHHRLPAGPVCPGPVGRLGRPERRPRRVARQGLQGRGRHFGFLWPVARRHGPFPGRPGGAGDGRAGPEAGAGRHTDLPAQTRLPGAGRAGRAWRLALQVRFRPAPAPVAADWRMGRAFRPPSGRLQRHAVQAQPDQRRKHRQPGPAAGRAAARGLG